MANIDEIKAMLSSITQGEWSIQRTYNIYTDVGTDHEELVVVLEEFSPTDADFIVAAPRLVRELLAEVETHRKVAALMTKVLESMRAFHRAQTVEAAINLEDAVKELEAVK